MSFCRHSQSGEGSDVHCYLMDDQRIAINVATRRLPECLPSDEEFGLAAYVAMLDGAVEVIDLPGAGEEFVLDSPEAAIQKLTELKNMGFRVPEMVFERLAEHRSDDT